MAIKYLSLFSAILRYVNNNKELADLDEGGQVPLVCGTREQCWRAAASLQKVCWKSRKGYRNACLPDKLCSRRVKGLQIFAYPK